MSKSSGATYRRQLDAGTALVSSLRRYRRTSLTLTTSPSFFVTDAQRRFTRFCDTCREYGYCGLYTGTAGSGLSWAARRYARWDLFLQVLARPYLTEMIPQEVASILRTCHTLVLSPLVYTAPYLVQRELIRLRRALLTIHEHSAQLSQPTLPLLPTPLSASPMSVGARQGASRAAAGHLAPSSPSYTCLPSSSSFTGRTMTSHLVGPPTRTRSAQHGHEPQVEVRESRLSGDLYVDDAHEPASETAPQQGRGLLHLLIVDEADTLPLAYLEDLCHQANEERFGLIALGAPQFADHVQAHVSLRRLFDCVGQVGALRQAEAASIVQWFEDWTPPRAVQGRGSQRTHHHDGCRPSSTRTLRARRAGRSTADIRYAGPSSRRLRALYADGGGSLRTLLHLLQRAAWERWERWEQQARASDARTGAQTTGPRRAWNTTTYSTLVALAPTEPS